MTDRAQSIDAFLAKTIWRDWKRSQIASDASARRYLRLSNGSQSVILMDAPPQDGESTEPFAEIANLLSSNRLSAPHIMAHDAADGLMVISDLGDNDFASWLQTRPQDTQMLYQAATDVLITLDSVIVPAMLPRMTPDIGADMILITGEHYAQRDVSGLRNTLEVALRDFAPQADTLALRDYHAENLIWREDHEGNDCVGLLDFQDAFVAPAGYDLASLLRDARRDVPDHVVEKTITYFAENTRAAPTFRTQVACLGIQRNLRILGVFARLSKVMNKTRYLQFMPRVWRNITADLQDPALESLRQSVLETIPEPTPIFCEGLKP